MDQGTMDEEQGGGGVGLEGGEMKYPDQCSENRFQIIQQLCLTVTSNSIWWIACDLWSQ